MGVNMLLSIAAPLFARGDYFARNTNAALLAGVPRHYPYYPYNYPLGSPRFRAFFCAASMLLIFRACICR
jgi:hypothetical protein